MLFWLSLLFLLISVVLMYVVILRPVLKSYHFFDDFYVKEKSLWESLMAFRTIMAAKFVALASVLIELYDMLAPLAAGVDWSPITASVPPAAWPFITLAIAALFWWLRKITATPPAEVAPIIGAEEPEDRAVREGWKTPDGKDFVPDA